MRTRVRWLGAIGDVHCEDRALAAALRSFEERQTDAVVCVGDLVDGSGDVNRCLSLLVEHDVLTVRGNHDRWIAEDELRDLPGANALDELDPVHREFLASLPQTASILTSAGELLLCHGVGTDDMQRLEPEDEGYALESNLALQRLLTAGTHRFMLGGHTHERMVRTLGGMTFFNAGTLKRDDQPCFLWIDFERRLAEFHDVGPDGVVAGRETVAF